jgi:hypothetical protein
MPALNAVSPCRNSLSGGIQSAQSLETKDIQEFLLAVSDFLKSAELVSHGVKASENIAWYTCEEFQGSC